MKRLLCLLFCAILGSVAVSHPLDMGLLELRGDSRELNVKFGVHPQVVADLLKVESDKLASVSAGSVFEATLKKGEFLSDGAACEWSDATAVFSLIDDQNVALSASLACPTRPKRLSVRLPFLKTWGATFRVLVVSKLGESDNVITLSPEKLETEINIAEDGSGFFHLVTLGIDHIGALPASWRGPEGFHLPEGIDHILFVVALILAGGTAAELLKIVTGFTLGHSVTLALGALGFFQLPTQFVESVIALSILAVAAEVWFPKFHEHRWKIASFFGLMHGLGFASAIRELRLEGSEFFKALVGFNIGVELGQLVVIGCTLPFLLALKRKPAAYQMTIRVLSGAIALLAAYWFVQRAFGLSES